MISLAVLFLFSLNARAEMIFLDLNDAVEEREECKKGIQAGNIVGERKEKLHVIDPKKRPRKRGESSLKTDTYHALREKLKDMVAKGIPVDSIVISGEDGSGEFFGSQGKFPYHELHDLVREFPQVARTLKSAAVWGCYTTTVNGSEQYWLNKLPNMQFTMGFVTQGPNKTRPANHALLRQFCERRQEAAQATTMDQLCRFYDSLQQLTSTSLGVCNRQGIASREYAVGGRGEKCFSYKQLHDRCPSFIDNKELQSTYDRYMNGDSEPPADTEERVTDLRYYYNEVSKWRHCAQKYKAERKKENAARGISEEDRPTDMPTPANLIRLIKYNKIKANMAVLNASELAAYDRALERAGLGALRVGDITKLSRKSLNEKIMAAVGALSGKNVAVPASTAPPRGTTPCSGRGGGFMFSGCEETTDRPAAARMSRQTVRAVEDPTLLRMAQCMRQTFVNMNHECSPFDLVGDHPKSQSMCLMSYGEAQQKSVDDDDAC